VDNGVAVSDYAAKDTAKKNEQLLSCPFSPARNNIAQPGALNFDKR
jgi:hypothetical protein